MNNCDQMLINPLNLISPGGTVIQPKSNNEVAVCKLQRPDFARIEQIHLVMAIVGLEIKPKTADFLMAELQWDHAIAKEERKQRIERSPDWETIANNITKDLI